MDYKSSGVDQEKANRLITEVKRLAATTARPEIVGGIGGFAGFFSVPAGYHDPVLLAATDGVGTKLLVAVAAGRHDTVGTDLVAMNTNDLVCHGAEPLFFLDYIAIPELVEKDYLAILTGVAEGCRQSGCALLGGETAQLPGLYAPRHYDLAGFALGICERDSIIDGSKVAAGDVLVGLPSSGLHSNGFSLARRALLGSGRYTIHELIPELGKTLAEELLTPTRIYVKPVLDLLSAGMDIHAIGHITGGGFYDNIPRVLPEGLDVVLKAGAWPVLPVFEVIERQGRVSFEEMHRVFNMGIGMVVFVAPFDLARVGETWNSAGQRWYAIGNVKGGGARRVVVEAPPAAIRETS
jgi:phosphoribosylformylglycinamidine cyclo-ligase